MLGHPDPPPPAVSASPAPAAPMEPAQIFFGFRGRIARRTWWLYGVAAMLGLGLLLTALLRIAGLDPDAATGVVSLLLLWPSVAISVKRWHDRDKSAWWVLVGLIPVIGGLWLLIENGMLRGTPGPNRYGPDPLQAP